MVQLHAHTYMLHAELSTRGRIMQAAARQATRSPRPPLPSSGSSKQAASSSSLRQQRGDGQRVGGRHTANAAFRAKKCGSSYIEPLVGIVV